MFTLTISTPFFNEEDGINHFTETLTKILKIIPNYIKVSLLWINDGSTDNTLDKLISKKKFFPNNEVKIISHKKNYGYLYSIKKCLGRFLRSIIRIVYYILTNDKKNRTIYTYRLLGLINSIFLKKSIFRINFKD